MRLSLAKGMALLTGMLVLALAFLFAMLQNM